MRPPVRIPGIEIGETLGQGAFSVVYRAMRGVVPCALKLPHVRGRWTRWVYREAVALARVHHVGLPRVLEVGEVDGLPYLLMELVEGENLADRLRAGPLSREETLEVACQLADTLRAVHEVGLVHRDVKPQNVILDAKGDAKLVDFGFAAPLGSGETNDALGTRRYSAPEQFRTPDRVDGRADLYALGRVLTECLSGHPPSESDAGRVVVELAASGVPTAIARIIGGLVAENPEDRYPDAVAVLGELHRVRAGSTPRGVAACEPSRLQGPLVGRDTELERFVRSWREVEVSGGRVILVEGRRGSGKSRFMQACTRRVREEGRGRSLECECREGDPPIAALRRIFESYFGSLRWMPPQDRATAAAALRVAASGALAPIAAVISPAFGDLLEPAEAVTSVVPNAFAEGAAELLVRLAHEAGPLLLCVDDLQWMDPLSREALAAVADRAGEAPLLVLAAARTGAEGEPSPLDSLGRKRATRVQLGPLELRQSAALIAARLGVASVDPALVRRVVSMADDTPVGILEVLGAMLDAGALKLRDDAWELDAPRLERVALPGGALAYLGRRVGELSPATRRILDVGAILGRRFDDELLGLVSGVDGAEVRLALADARRAGLLELEGTGGHRFGHDSIREMLTGEMDPAARRALHQRAAEQLATTRELTPDLAYACAMHFAEGDLESAPRIAYLACRTAGEGVLDRFDNETALRCFDLARRAAEAAGITLDAPFHRRVGEANLRIGALDESLRAFEAALGLARDDVDRASILVRLAWVRRARTEPAEAVAALGEALQLLGAPPLGEAADASRPGRGPVGRTPEALDLLCEIYQQGARLGFESGQSARALESMRKGLALARVVGPSVAISRAHATYGAGLLSLGLRAQGRRQLAKAEAIASSLADPAAMAFYLPRRVASFAFAGQFDRALKALRTCADDYAPWLEVAEFCNLVANGDVFESVRGRADEAWGWIVRATDRLRRRQRTSAVFASYILFRARAALATRGRSAEEGPWLSAQLEAVGDAPADGAFNRVLSWGPRARILLDTGALGVPLEELIRDFQSNAVDPRTAPLPLVEYYVAIAHARVQQCLRAGAGERSTQVAALARAASDLRAAARVPLIQSHSLLADGVLAWLEGRGAAARRLLAQAGVLAESETCPWVASSVARIRAHMLRERGKLEAARDQARIAELLARTHGAEPRAQVIREEFSLPAPEVARQAGSSIASSVLGSSRMARRQLASLLHIVRVPYDQLDATAQGAAMVNDLVRELSAERGLLIFEPADPRGRLFVGRTRLGEAVSRTTTWQDALLRAVRSVEDAADVDEIGALPPTGDGRVDRARVVVCGLFLSDRMVGVVCLERGPRDPAFTHEDREMVHVLAQQVPVALELARLLGERDQLNASFQQMQKMEVVGQLAGSVAHDFGNMVQAIEAGVEGLRINANLDHEAREDIEIMMEGTNRARLLTAKLLAFSRQQPLPVARAQINDSIKSLGPLVRRMATRLSTVSLTLDLAPDVHPVLTDLASFEQAIVNLAVNARDAMPMGGTLTIRSRNVVLDADAARLGGVPRGDYVCVEVADEGEGIPQAMLDRIFDPFFTTKPVGKGTGLGLTTVYSFVKKTGGDIKVESEVGRGTVFRLFLPRAAEAPAAAPRPSIRPSVRPAPGSPVILVVDDDPAVREATCTQLKREGYVVLAADGSADALRVAEGQGREISLVILDVHMPGMNGPELGRRFDDMHLPAKVLFMTGLSGDDLPEGMPHGGDRLLHKPFSGKDLIGRVRHLLDS